MSPTAQSAIPSGESFVRSWLPQGALTDETTHRALQGAVADWAARWFVGEAPRLTALEPSSARGPAPAIAFARHRQARLAGAALGVDLDSVPRTTADRLVMDALGDVILADLLAALERVAGPREYPDRADRGGEWILLKIGDGRADWITIPFSAAALVRLRKGACIGSSPVGPTASTSLPDRRAGLQKLPVTIEGRLGVAQIRLDEFRALEPGDVVILERSLDDFAELCLEGSNFAFARATLKPSRTGPHLTLITSPS